jgi:hypothetical protein
MGRDNIMRVIKTTVYEFDELSDKAKTNALEEMWDINVDYDWWHWVYDDAETVGIKIQGFDIGRGQSVNFEFIDSALDTARAIEEGWGEQCDGYKESVQFRIQWEETATQAEADELERKYKRCLHKVYLDMLDKEYEYQTSSEAVKQTLIANGYEFTEDGKRF